MDFDLENGDTQPQLVFKDVRPPGKKRRTRSSRLSISLLLLGFGALLLIALVVPLTAYLYFQLYNVIVPGVQVADLDMGGLSYQEALDGLNLVYGTDPQIQLSFEERGWNVPASELGLSWDPVATVQLALNQGHGKEFLQEIQETWDSLIRGASVDPVLAFNDHEARIGLSAFARNVDVPPVNASLEIIDGQVSVMPAIHGIRLDVESTLANLANDPLKVMRERSLALVITDEPAQVTDVSSAVLEAERVLDSQIELRGFDPIENVITDWTISREELGSWFDVDLGNQFPEVVLNEQRILDFLDGINRGLDAGESVRTEGMLDQIISALGTESEIEARIYHDPTTYVVQDGDTLLKLGWRLEMPYWRIMDANPELYDYGLQTGQEILIPSKDDLLPLPIVPGKRIILSISDQRLWTFENGEVRDEYIISTGIDKSPTQPGVFQVQTHELNAYASVWDLTMPHFLGIYEAWPGFMNGLHELPILSNGKRLWKDILGKPASFGCIILDIEPAQNLYNWAENGVVVEIIE